MIVSETEVRAALAYMDKVPGLLSNAVYRATKAERMLKHTKSLAMKQHNSLPITAQEREAYASPHYLAALEEDAKAAADLAGARASYEGARLVIDVWRTEESSARAAGKFG